MVICISFLCFSQEQNQASFGQLTVNDGLSQNSVVSITQDSIGYLWFATQDGLNKYEGHTFQYFNKQYQDITRANFTQLGQLYTDAFGDLWSYASDENIERYNYKSGNFDMITTVKKATVFFRKNVKELWLGTLDNGIVILNLNSKKTSNLAADSLKDVAVFDIQYYDNNIYLGTSKGLYRIDEQGKIVNFECTAKYNISSLTKRDNTIILGTFQHGVKCFNIVKNELINYFDSNLPSNLNIQDVFLDSKRRLWIATYGDGLYMVNDANQARHYIANKEDSFALHYNDILKIYEDNTGNIWFGSDGGGLSYYDEHLVKFNMLTSKQVPENVLVDVVRSITVDSVNQVWLGTSGNGLTRLEMTTKDYETLTTDNSDLSSNRVMSLLYDEGVIWIGHQATGLQKLTNKNQFQSFPKLSALSIWKIYKGKNENLWLCTRASGLLLIDSEANVLRRYTSENSALTTNNIRTAEYGGTDELWIGTEEDGLFKLNLNTNTIEKNELIIDKIKTLTFYDDMLWIGTNGNGIKRLNSQSNDLIRYIGDAQLPNNVVYAILPDTENNFWVTTNKGISRFSPTHPNKQYVENYTLINGLQAFEFNTGAYFKAPNGMLYFGGIEGINWFNPETISYNEVVPKTVISKFQVFGKTYSTDSYHEFKHNKNTVTFTFAGLHFSHPEKNLYRYKLEGLDENWTQPEYNNMARYTSLPPNDYTFKVLSSNYEGRWNKVPTTYSFTILKPWYATHLAYFIYTMLVLASFYMIYRYFKFRWEMNIQLKLEHAEAERLKQLDEFKTKLYTNISHEFRTPLTLISGPIDKQLSNNNLAKTDRHELELVKQNANRLLGLVEQMMDLSLLDAGQIKLKVKQDNLGIILKQLVAAFQYKANEKHITIESSINDLDECWFDRDIIEKISSNLLSNAIKYAPEQTIVVFDAHRQNDHLFLSVVNTNIELKADTLGQLFERFYQNNEASEGIGVGLALVKDLVTLSKGSILANTLDENKIQFNVTLPIDRAAFSDSEMDSTKLVPVEDLNSGISLNNDQPLLLIVEDDTDIRNFVSSIFETQYEILNAENGKIGIDLALKHIPDIIISDIMMPVQDGIELCNTLKYNELTSHVPIILLTAKVGEEHEIQGLKTGADAYITKPFNSEKLQLRVQMLIENRKQLQKHFSKDFIVNPEITITSTEADFLKRLKTVLDDKITDSEFTSEKFAETMLMSRMQLHRKLKAIVGMTTTEFIRSQRLKLAVDLLKTPGATVSEIAYQVGFNTPSYFIKCFKEAYGVTPNEYD